MQTLPTSMEDAVIGPLVRRHTEDAAFYWNLLDSANQSHQLQPERLRHFQGILEAHLEGLEVAGAEGWLPALSALEKWKKPGEAFACTWLAVLHPAEGAVEALLGHVSRRPDSLLRGVVSGLAWAPTAARKATITSWLADDVQPVAQVAALRAIALLGAEDAGTSAVPLHALLASADAQVRAAACRAAAVLPEYSNAALRALLADEELTVRAEAALALAARGDRKGVLAVLWQCVAAQAKLAEEATGWYRMQAARRLDRWVRHLAWLAPMGHADLSELYAFLPARIGLSFALYHGDPTHLAHVLERMADPEQARYAGWVWQTLTGIDLPANALTLPEPELSPDELNVVSDARLDADRGLPLPNVEAIRNVQGRLSFTLKDGQRLLLGQAMALDLLMDLVEHAPQALRAIAAHALSYLESSHPIQVRGPAWQQRQQLEALRGALRV